MFAFSGSTKEIIENSVHATGVPLSERFKHVPSHNPLRPSQEVKRIVRGFHTAPTSNARNPRNPIHNTHRERFPGFGSGVNKLAVVKATKDAEILRLRAQLHSMELQLRRVGNGQGRNNPLKTIIGKLPMKNRAGNFMVKRRGGGGFVVGPNGGKHLNLQSTSALSVLGIDKVRRNPRSPIKGHGPARSGKNLNFFGPPRSKADLDKELDSYMSQTKSKKKTDLDKELDEYMKVARSQSFAGKIGLVGLTPTTPPPDVDSDEGQMEIVE